jgi:hypothetical protein
LVDLKPSAEIPARPVRAIKEKLHVAYNIAQDIDFKQKILYENFLVRRCPWAGA